MVLAVHQVAVDLVETHLTMVHLELVEPVALAVLVEQLGHQVKMVASVEHALTIHLIAQLLLVIQEQVRLG